MKPFLHFLRSAALASFLISGIHAADLHIIANPSIPASWISADDFQRIFLGTKSSLPDGTRVEPVLQKSGAAHQTVLKNLLGKTDTGLLNYYRSLIFTGRGSMPKFFDSNAAVAAYVAKTKGAIGYVGAGTDIPGVKILEVK